MCWVCLCYSYVVWMQAMHFLCLALRLCVLCVFSTLRFLRNYILRKQIYALLQLQLQINFTGPFWWTNYLLIISFPLLSYINSSLASLLCHFLLLICLHIHKYRQFCKNNINNNFLLSTKTVFSWSITEKQSINWQWNRGYLFLSHPTFVSHQMIIRDCLDTHTTH